MTVLRDADIRSFIIIDENIEGRLPVDAWANLLDVSEREKDYFSNCLSFVILYF